MPDDTDNTPIVLVTAFDGIERDADEIRWFNHEQSKLFKLAILDAPGASDRLMHSLILGWHMRVGVN